MDNANELSVEAIVALERGRVLEAIKIVRQQTGLGLKESKDLVEEYIDQHSATLAPSLAQRRASGSYGMKVLIVLITIGWLVYLLIMNGD